MFNKALLFLFATVILVSFSTVSYSQDHGKMDAKKEAVKSEMTKGEKEMGSLQTFQCPSPCDFTVKSRDESEILAVAKMHVKKHHNMEMSDKEVKGMMKGDETKKDVMPKK
jgi:predicted small metal-binding protein